MDTVLNQFLPPPYNENSESESQLEKKYKAENYKIMRLLTDALVYLIMIIFYYLLRWQHYCKTQSFNLNGRVRRKTKSGTYWSLDR